MSADLKQSTVLMLVDPGVVEPGPSLFRPDVSDGHLASALQRLFGRVVVHINGDLLELARTLNEEKPDLVFNYTQLAAGDRRNDSHVCAVLDLLGVTYTGTGAKGLMLCRDKGLSKLVAGREGFRVPGYFVPSGDAPVPPSGIAFPLVVKPRFGDASEGVSQASFVRAPAALAERVAALRRAGYDDLICEEYIGGREMIVGVVGDRMIAPREFLIGRQGRGAPKLACVKFKYDKAYRARWRVSADFAVLDADQSAKLQDLLLKTSRALEIRDYGRFDVKLTESGEWAFLEANPNPGLAPFGSSFAGTWGGIDYDEMIKDIVLRALARRSPGAVEARRGRRAKARDSAAAAVANDGPFAG